MTDRRELFENRRDEIEKEDLNLQGAIDEINENRCRPPKTSKPQTTGSQQYTNDWTTWRKHWKEFRAKRKKIIPTQRSIIHQIPRGPRSPQTWKQQFLTNGITTVTQTPFQATHIRQPVNPRWRNTANGERKKIRKKMKRRKTRMKHRPTTQHQQ